MKRYRIIEGPYKNMTFKFGREYSLGKVGYAPVNDFDGQIVLGHGFLSNWSGAVDLDPDIKITTKDCIPLDSGYHVLCIYMNKNKKYWGNGNYLETISK